MKITPVNLLPLNEYDTVIVSYSGGKDSLACLLRLLDLGVDRSKIELWHQHIDGEPGVRGLMDWPVTEAYVRATGEATGIPVLFQWKHGGFEREMCRKDAPTAPISFETLEGDVVTLPTKRETQSTREKFPQVSADLSVRWCSAYLKIDVAARAINNDPRFLGKKVLVVTGERRQESAARSKYQECEVHRCHSGKKTVHQWRAVIDFTEEQVWDLIEAHGYNPHPAYHLGFGRVSCMKCIFAGADQWNTVRELDLDGFTQIAGYEKRWGTTIHRTKSVVEQANAGSSLIPEDAHHYRAIGMGTKYTVEMLRKPGKRPAGAFRSCGGPT